MKNYLLGVLGGMTAFFICLLSWSMGEWFLSLDASPEEVHKTQYIVRWAGDNRHVLRKRFLLLTEDGQLSKKDVREIVEMKRLLECPQYSPPPGLDEVRREFVETDNFYDKKKAKSDD